jgi:hypothetical protein
MGTKHEQWKPVFQNLVKMDMHRDEPLRHAVVWLYTHLTERYTTQTSTSTKKYVAPISNAHLYVPWASVRCGGIIEAGP